MPVFSDAVGAGGPLVRVEVGVSERHRQQLFTAYRPVPQPVGLNALLDTGAGISCVDPWLIGRLQLQPKGGFRVVNAPGLGGLTFPRTYEVSLAVLHPAGDPADRLVITDLDVADVTLGIMGIDLLLGRDVLALCDFNYLGRAGTFTLTY
jgi:hypothetical protein